MSRGLGDVYKRQELLLAEQHMSANFNACLFNYYPTGDDGMGYHADNESELGNEPIIASVSLGAVSYTHLTLPTKA